MYLWYILYLILCTHYCKKSLWNLRHHDLDDDESRPRITLKLRNMRVAPTRSTLREYPGYRILTMLQVVRRHFTNSSRNLPYHSDSHAIFWGHYHFIIYIITMYHRFILVDWSKSWTKLSLLVYLAHRSQQVTMNRQRLALLSTVTCVFLLGSKTWMRMRRKPNTNKGDKHLPRATVNTMAGF